VFFPERFVAIALIATRGQSVELSAHLRKATALSAHLPTRGQQRINQLDGDATVMQRL